MQIVQKGSGNMDHSIHKDILDWYSNMETTWTSKEVLCTGLNVYRNTITVDMNVINTIETVLMESNQFDWQECTVGFQEKILNYRDAKDFKYKHNLSGYTNAFSEKHLSMMDDMYNKVHHAELHALKDYCAQYDVGMLKFYEATNFIKYGKDQHFDFHSDHGFSYQCTVSVVSYPNDDYVGGELEFKHQGLKIKPQAGDTYIFPSNYLFTHKACPVDDGVKYSLVTPWDYSDGSDYIKRSY